MNIDQIPVRSKRYTIRSWGPLRVFLGHYEWGRQIQVHSRFLDWHIAPAFGQVWFCWHLSNWDVALYVGWADGTLQVSVI